MAALRGEPVDRVPLSFWLHNFATENAVDSFVAETLRLAREFDVGILWDVIVNKLLHSNVPSKASFGWNADLSLGPSL
jgi:hypothetical protein